MTTAIVLIIVVPIVVAWALYGVSDKREANPFVLLSINTDNGWRNFEFEAKQQQINACYKLEKGADRIEYWRNVTHIHFPNGRAVIWSVK